MLKRRSLLAVLLAIVTSLTLFACAEETPPAADEPAADQPADTEPADEPASGDLEIVATDYEFEFPSAVTAGNHIMTLRNDGEEVHQAIIVELLDGKTAEDALEYIETTSPDAPPPSWARVAAIGFGEPGAGGFLQPTDKKGNPAGGGDEGIDLTAGNYLMICLIPEGTTDANAKPDMDAQPHAALGMTHEFTVE